MLYVTGWRSVTRVKQYRIEITELVLYISFVSYICWLTAGRGCIGRSV